MRRAVPWAHSMSDESVLQRVSAMGEARSLADAFLGYSGNVRRLSPHTVRAYQTDLRAFLDWCEREGVAPLEATRRSMRAYVAYMGRAGYATKTINRRISSLKSFYGWIEREERGTASAAATLRSRKDSKELPKTMTDADLCRLMETCDLSHAEGVRDRAFLELLYATGARISEVAGLKACEVDPSAGHVRLFGKRSKERVVPLYERAAQALNEYLLHARPILVAACHRQERPQALFVSTRGNDMGADALRRVFHSHLLLAGLDPALTPHAVRHSFATELLAGGADLKSVQELLGHQSLATTQIYTHLSIDRLKDAARQAHPRG